MEEVLNESTRQGSAPWFAVRVRSRFEKAVAAGLRGKGYEEFLPLRRKARLQSDRPEISEIPMFPGYVFCRIDPERRLPVLTTRGVVSLIGIGKVPMPIPEDEIAALRSIMLANLAARPCRFPSTGDRVKVCQGPLAGVHGIVISQPDSCQIVVSVQLLQRSVSVEMNQSWLRPEASPEEQSCVE